MKIYLVLGILENGDVPLRAFKNVVSADNYIKVKEKQNASLEFQYADFYKQEIELED